MQPPYAIRTYVVGESIFTDAKMEENNRRIARIGVACRFAK